MKILTAAFAAGLAVLGAAVVTPSASAQAAPFLDTPTNHWAYEAVQDLAKKGIVIGYPDGTYGGKRPMTRYEFAVALDRALRTVSDMISANPPAGTPPVQTVTQDDINRLQALIDKFRPELDTIQTNLQTAQDNIDALRADVLDAKALANKAQDTANNSYGVGAEPQVPDFRLHPGPVPAGVCRAGGACPVPAGHGRRGGSLQRQLPVGFQPQHL